MFPKRVVERVLSKWHLEGECWVSDYSRGSHGYAQVGWNEDGTRMVTVAHRVAWWGANQRLIEPGMTVDHLCKNRPCVNPSHLRLIQNALNASDNGKPRLDLPVVGTCHKGHPLVKGRSKPHCRECNAERARNHRALLSSGRPPGRPKSF